MLPSEPTRYSFLDDYSEGCHANILAALAATNMCQQTAYGEDEYTKEAKSLIRQELNMQDIPVHLIATGTLANIISIAACLRPHEAVVAASSGHIVVRETGAIEATGHKIINLPAVNGKLTVHSIQSALEANAHFPHMAKPRLVYISNATEVGTIYTKAELTAISNYCRDNGLLLFLDGARLGAALAAECNDLTMTDIAKLTDIFWIGGTKLGALLGEAIVIPNPMIAADFSFHVKQRGSLLAKGRILGLQFRELFSSGLFHSLPKFANEMATQLSCGVIDAGYQLEAETETNQVFPILPNDLINSLSKDFAFYTWEKRSDDHSVIRLVTSWATDESQVRKFVSQV
jgi:threonine aldolase